MTKIYVRFTLSFVVVRSQKYASNTVESHNSGQQTSRNPRIKENFSEVLLYLIQITMFHTKYNKALLTFELCRGKQLSSEYQMALVLNATNMLLTLFDFEGKF